MGLVSIGGRNVLSRAGKVSGKKVTEGTETHDEERLLMCWTIRHDPKKHNWRADFIVVADR